MRPLHSDDDNKLAGKVGDYQVFLLGKPIILQNNVPFKVMRNKCKGIIYYLAAKNEYVSRDKLQDLFWSEFDQQTGQHNLNVHFSYIRKQLPGLILAEESYIQINPNVKVDSRFFDSYFAKDEFDEEKHNDILSLYRGDFWMDSQLATHPISIIGDPQCGSII